MSKLDVVNEIHKNARINYPRRNVILKDIDDLWQADLIDMQTMSKVNYGFNYILAVIDCFSKYAWAIPLKKKSKELVSKAFETLLKKRIPNNLQTDFGKEFYNDKFDKILKTNDINHYSTYSTEKASIVERFIRTLKNKLYKEFSLKRNYKWIDGTLDNKLYEYNHSFHRTIKQTPASVNQTNKKNVLRSYANISKKANNLLKCKRFQVGDSVRISKYKGCFEKGFTPNWSTEIFKISKVQDTLPTTYLLEDVRKQPILGAFYAQELQKTKYPEIYLIERILKRKGNKFYVKWLGLPTSENCWIDKQNCGKMCK